MCVFKIGTAVADHHRRHFRIIRPHDNGMTDHEDKPRIELYDKPPCGCNSICNPCAKDSGARAGKTVCICHNDKPYCAGTSANEKNCKLNSALLLEHLKHYNGYLLEQSVKR